MKKVFSLVLAVVMAFSMAACNSGVSQEEYDALKAELDSLKSESSSAAVDATAEPTDAPVEVDTNDGKTNWTVNDFSFYEVKTGKLMYSGREMDLADLNEKSDKGLQLLRGIKIGSTAQDLVDAYDFSRFYSSATSIGNTDINLSDDLRRRIENFNAEYPDAEKKLMNIDAAVEQNLGVFLSCYFFVDNDENLQYCRINEKGNQEDYDETKGFDRYHIVFQIDRGVVSDVSIKHNFALETDQNTIDFFYDMTLPVLKELGETKEVRSFILEKPRDLEINESLDDASMRIASVYASRYVRVVFLRNSDDDAWRIGFITDHDDTSHYYYYPNARTASSIIPIQLYDYITDKPIMEQP